MHKYHRQTKLNAPPSVVFAWHAAPGAFDRLKPTWVKMDVVAHGGIVNGALADLRVGIPVVGLPIPWKFRHEGYVEGTQFVDRQISGPFKSWKHLHRFLPDGDGCIIDDQIEFALPLPVPFMAAFVKAELDRLFDYREEVLRREFG